MAHVELIGLTKRFGDLHAVDDISLRIEQGEFFTIVGPSGCGKSTTLRMIAGFETPSSGRLTINDVDIDGVPSNERDVGLVFQSYALFPHMTAAENVGFGLRMQGVSEDERSRRVAKALSLVDLPDIGDQYPGELSGGQQQRVALARALVIEPDVLLLDEPLSNLDQQLREELQTELKRIQAETGVTTIHVTHDQEEAMTLADRMCVLRDGKVEQVAPPKAVYNEPKSPFVSDFVGKANAVAATVIQDGGEQAAAVAPTPSLRFPVPETDRNANGDGTIVFRPEDVVLGPSYPKRDDETRFEATVDAKQFRGEFMRYTLTYAESNGKTVELIAHDDDGYAVGDDVPVSVRHNDVIYHLTGGS